MNIRGSSMFKSDLKKTIDEFGDDYGKDETVPLLPKLGHVSTDGETPVSGVGHANADVIDERLRQMVGLLESMHRSLEKIADLLAKPARRSRPRTAKKKKSASRKSSKT
jgi:hypothetical protein